MRRKNLLSHCLFMLISGRRRHQVNFLKPIGPISQLLRLRHQEYPDLIASVENWRILWLWELCYRWPKGKNRADDRQMEK